MSDISLSQTVPISRVPRDYLSLFRRSARREEPVVVLRHGKPVGALVAQSVLEALMEIRRKYEEEKVLRIVRRGDREYREGKTVTKLLPWK